jgi:hypothetical protein
MDGFKPMVKMKCGGSVSSAVEKSKKMCSGGKMKEGGDVDKKQDKSLIKKAFKQHDEQEHPGEKTELKLKKGGRSKKAEGTVKKYKAGGAIEMKKDAGDKADIKKIKATKVKKETTEVPGFADGSYTGTPSIPPELLEQIMRAKAAGQGMSRPQQGGMVPQGGMPQPQGGGMPSPNAYQRFQQANPNATPGMTPEQIRQILMSPQFQQSNRNFTDR